MCELMNQQHARYTGVDGSLVGINMTSSNPYPYPQRETSDTTDQGGEMVRNYKKMKALQQG